MKSKIVKQREAFERAKKYSYDNSRAKRKGVSKAEWEAKNAAFLAAFEAQYRG